MAGGGCAIPPAPLPPPAPKACPGPGWLEDEAKGEAGCCTLLGADLNRSWGCAGGSAAEACARAQCTGSPKAVHVWKPEDYKHRPFTCCAAESSAAF
jgi:hypothetical protein